MVPAIVSNDTTEESLCRGAGRRGFCYNFMFRPAGEFDMANPLAAGPSGEPKMDAASLYREEIYTDRVAATLRVLIPVTKEGAPDTARPTLYLGEAQILTNMGPLPINFEIEAKHLSEAVAKYGESAKKGIESAMRELQEMRRQQSSSLVIPQGGVPNLSGAGKI